MAKAKGINWKLIVASALHLLVKGAAHNAHEAVRNVLEAEEIASSELPLDQYDSVVTTVQSLHETLDSA